MHDQVYRVQETLHSLQEALSAFTAGDRDRLFESRDVLRDLVDWIEASNWSYASPVCEAVQEVLGNVLRHGGLTEADAITLASELLAFVGSVIERPAPGISEAKIIHGSTPKPQEEYERLGQSIRISVDRVDETRLGEIMVKMGALTAAQLTQALGLQQVCRKRLGEVLIQMGLIEESVLQGALERQRLATLQVANEMQGPGGGLEVRVAEPDIAESPKPLDFPPTSRAG